VAEAGAKTSIEMSVEEAYRGWRGKAEKLKAVLGLKSEPVGVKYVDEVPEGAEEGCFTVCGAILRASEGKRIVLSMETCACPGGVKHLGLGEAKVPVKLLVEGEKLWADLAAFYRSSEATRRIAEPLKGLGRNVVLYPLKEGIYDPDLVILLVNAEQACRLVTLNQFWDGRQSSMEMRGSLCWSSITYPLASGNMNVSLGDISARRMEGWDPNLLIVSIPVRRLDGILKAMDLSTAGAAESSELFKEMASRMASRKYKAAELMEWLASKA
jgi:uncharacterized protein (DUF169 family)